MGWVIFAVAVLLVATGARAYAIQTYFVPTPSMTPTLMPGDRILVNKLASTIHRGDIVVFHDPPADKGGPPTLVKRVIGLPGETISSSGSTVLIDGKPLAEPWLPPLNDSCTESAENIKSQKIGADDYFVMGDCRGDSGDSRFFGTVRHSDIIGKVDLIIWRNGHPWIHWF
jgi:signal peptidase I